MYAKIYDRIVESSLMETPIEVRYTFVFLLAIADLTGHVIGTDIAIARRLNMPLEDFQRCIAELGEPDSNSNSQECDGRRVVASEIERGYRIVNYETYRDIRDAEERREYMREYMRKRRASSGVNGVNSGEPVLAELAHAPAEAPAPVKECAKPSSFDQFWSVYPRKIAKADAIKAWAKLKLDAIAGTIIAAVVAQKRGWKDPKFIPYPASWLNAKRWEDEIQTHGAKDALGRIRS